MSKEKQKLQQNSQRKYRKIVLEERQELIRLVIGEKLKIIQASRRLKINPSTARIILQNYKQEGRIYQKRSERLERREKDKKQKEMIETMQKPEQAEQIENNFEIQNPILPAMPYSDISNYQIHFPVYFQYFALPF